MGLDEKAIEAVRRWKLKPAMKDGKPVAVEVAVQASFTLPK
jgi:protein TonB